MTERLMVIAGDPDGKKMRAVLGWMEFEALVKGDTVTCVQGDLTVEIKLQILNPEVMRQIVERVPCGSCGVVGGHAPGCVSHDDA